MVDFWATMYKGLDMMLIQYQLLNDGYSQVVLYNSTVSPSFGQRELILTSF